MSSSPKPCFPARSPANTDNVAGGCRPAAAPHGPHRPGGYDACPPLGAAPHPHRRPQGSSTKFRNVVAETMAMRQRRMRRNAGRRATGFPHSAFAARRSQGPSDGLSTDEIEDNILTFIGAGHETTARALAWTLYCVAQSPHVRAAMEEEIDRVMASGANPVDWLDQMPIGSARLSRRLCGSIRRHLRSTARQSNPIAGQARKARR